MGDLFGKTDHLKLSGKHDLKKKKLIKLFICI